MLRQVFVSLLSNAVKFSRSSVARHRQAHLVRHGGRVWAEGKTGEGATIGFALPLRTV